MVAIPIASRIVHICSCIGPLAQLVEQWTLNPLVEVRPPHDHHRKPIQAMVLGFKISIFALTHRFYILPIVLHFLLFFVFFAVF